MVLQLKLKKKFYYEWSILRLPQERNNIFFHQSSLRNTIDGFQKPVYALCKALTLCAKLLGLKKLLKSLALSVKWLCAQLLAFIKSTLGCQVWVTMFQTIIFKYRENSQGCSSDNSLLAHQNFKNNIIYDIINDQYNNSHFIQP